MQNDNARILRDLLIADFAGIDQRLKQRLGSADLAADVLQETYLRIEAMTEVDTIRNPKAYLFRIALNIANDRRRSQNRRLTEEEVDCLLDVPDDRPTPERQVEERSEIALLRRAIAELPERRRKVLIMSRIEDLPHREIAERLDVTMRTVETDLKQAIAHCADRMKRSAPVKFGFARRKTSYVQRRVVRDELLAPGVCARATDCEETKRSISVCGSVGPRGTVMDRTTEVRRGHAGGRSATAGLAGPKPGA